MNLLSKYRASLLASFFFVASMAPVAHAQVPETIARVDVPFAFDCGLRHFPAGVYNIVKSGDDNLLLIRGSSVSGFALMRMDVNSRSANTGKAVFRVSGNQHFLLEIWRPGSTNHITFYPSRAKHAVKMASNGIHQPDVELALLDALH